MNDIGKTSQKAVAKYKAKAYDTIQIYVPKGQKELLKSHAKACKQSLNAFINRAIDKFLQDDKSRL